MRGADGETLINATVYDLTSRQGTMTNAYGYFSITLQEGDHELRCGYIGYADKLTRVQLKADTHLDICLKQNASVREVTVIGDLNSPLINTQTGKRPNSQRSAAPTW